MPRRLIPLTNEVLNFDSGSDVDVSNVEKVKKLVTKWNGGRDNALDRFSKAQKNFEKSGGNTKYLKRKTIAEQKKLAHDRERKALEVCQSLNSLRLSKSEDVANVEEGNVSSSSLEAENVPSADIQSLSFHSPDSGYNLSAETVVQTSSAVEPNDKFLRDDRTPTKGCQETEHVREESEFKTENQLSFLIVNFHRSLLPSHQVEER